MVNSQVNNLIWKANNLSQALHNNNPTKEDSVRMSNQVQSLICEIETLTRDLSPEKFKEIQLYCLDAY